jgi:hypothetical protein
VGRCQQEDCSREAPLRVAERSIRRPAIPLCRCRPPEPVPLKETGGSSVTGSRPGPHERRFLDCVARSAPTKAVCRHLLRAATAERLLGAAQSRSPRAFDQVHSPLRGTVRPSDALTPSSGKNEANDGTNRPASRFCTSILVHHNQSSGARPNIAKAVNRPKL